MPSYIAPYRGVNTSLPAGYMDAATAPGRNIAAGITAAGEAIQAGLDKHREMTKLAKAMGVVHKALPPELKQMDDAAFENLSASDKISHVQGLAQAQGYMKGQSDLATALANRQHQKKSEAFMQTQGDYMKSQMDERKVELERKRAADEASTRSWSNFNDEMQQRLVRPEGEEVPDLTNPELLKAFARHNLLRDPIVDNVFNALSRANKPVTIRTGTVTDLPGIPGKRFLWQSENSGKEIDAGEPAPMQEPPPGYFVWTGPDGKSVLKRTVDDGPKLSASQDFKAQQMARNQAKLTQLDALRQAGIKRFDLDPAGSPVAYSGVNPWGGSPIDEEIALTQKMIENAERDLGAADAWRQQRKGAAAPAAAGTNQFEQFLKWRQGK